MKVFFEGTSHLTHWSKVGAAANGLNVCWHSKDADLIVIAHDMPTDDKGNRAPAVIDELVEPYRGKQPVLLMSQVPPGYCRKKEMVNLYYYPETLRIKDSYERACNPEYIIFGAPKPFDYDVTTDSGGLPNELYEYGNAFKCPISHLTYEEAEFAKIAVNSMLAVQVDYANRMQAACEKLGADWSRISGAIQRDKRIGPHAYLTPGRWQDSIHLLRDSVTLKEIEDA